MAAADDVANPFTYTGRQFDAESGIYQYRYRYYHAQLGRFVGRDPVAYLGGANLFGYLRSSPIDSSDPLGLIVPWIMTPPQKKYDFIIRTPWTIHPPATPQPEPGHIYTRGVLEDY